MKGNAKPIFEWSGMKWQTQHTSHQPISSTRSIKVPSYAVQSRGRRIKKILPQCGTASKASKTPSISGSTWEVTCTNGSHAETDVSVFQLKIFGFFAETWITALKCCISVWSGVLFCWFDCTLCLGFSQLPSEVKSHLANIETIYNYISRCMCLFFLPERRDINLNFFKVSNKKKITQILSLLPLLPPT